MDIQLINKLRSRISSYRADKVLAGGLTEFELTCCTTIELSVIFAELYCKIGRGISDNEIIYFQGGRFISDVIGSEPKYHDIYEMYYELASKVKTI